MTRAEALGVLGLTDGATDEDVKAAYRSLSLKVHPDVQGGSAELFRRVQAAYERLTEGPAFDDEPHGDTPNTPQATEEHFAEAPLRPPSSLRWWQWPFLIGLGPTTPKGCLLLLLAAVVGGGVASSGFPSPIPGLVESLFFLLAIGRIAALPLRVRRRRGG